MGTVEREDVFCYTFGEGESEKLICIDCVGKGEAGRQGFTEKNLLMLDEAEEDKIYFCDICKEQIVP